MPELWKGLMLILFLLFSFYIMGRSLSPRPGIPCLAVGFVLFLGLTELLTFWMVAFSLPRISFSLLVAVIYLLLMIPGLNRISLPQLPRTFTLRKLAARHGLWIGITLLMILLVIFFYRPDADDSFYVSNAALFQQTSRLNPYDSSFGIPSLGTVPMYDFQIWEALVSVLSNLFHLEAVSVMHLYLLPVLLTVSASAYLFLGQTLLGRNQKAAPLFYFFVSLFHLWGGYAVYSEGSFLLSRLWQGKSLYLTVILPLMTGLLLRCLKKNPRLLWAQLAICILAGMALNPTSLYVLGFQLFFLMLILALYRKQASFLLHMLPSLLLVVFFTLMIYLRTRQFSGQIEAASQADGAFVTTTFLNFLGEGKFYLIFYLLSLGIILWKGNRPSKVYAIFLPLALFLGIWNPLTGAFIARSVTKVPSYWRVFWLLPLAPSMACAGCLMEEEYRSSLRLRILSILATCLALILPGKWMFSSSNGFLTAKNAERLPEETLLLGQEMVSETSQPVVLACDALATTLRQKYLDLSLVYSRPQYILDLFQYRGEETQAAERRQLMEFSNGRLTDFQGITDLLDYYQVDYILLSRQEEEETAYLLDSGQWGLRDSQGSYVLLQAIP